MLLNVLLLIFILNSNAFLINNVHRSRSSLISRIKLNRNEKINNIAFKSKLTPKFDDSTNHLLKMVIPEKKGLLLLSIVFMILGKIINVKVPFMLQRVIDSVATASNTGISRGMTLISPEFFRTSSLAFLLYGLSRALSVVASEIKTCLFAHVSQNILRNFARNIFKHLHTLDSDFHLRTPSGTVSVAYVRAVRGFQTLLFQIIFSIAPTAIELFLVSSILFRRFGGPFAAVTIITFLSYLMFTIWITEWRVKLRQEMVSIDNARNGFFIDSILNQEMVKLFTNEKREEKRFDEYLSGIERLSIQSTYAIAALNLGQVAMFATGLTTSLILALKGIIKGTMTLGDLIAINALLIQLSVPFNSMGYTYQELRQSLVDMSYVRNLLFNVKTSINDTNSNISIDNVTDRQGPSTIEFKNVSFSYDENSSNDILLNNVSFKIEAGKSVAIVGPSGSGKSTILRLITRMLDATTGDIIIDGVNIKDVSVDSLRKRISVIPQDTSLFDGTIEYNIKYGNFSASTTTFNDAINRCNLAPVLNKFSEGLKTEVGERGARLSGGERQKVSIARALLKNPTIILCDEVTSSVDAFAEREIVQSLRKASESRTTISVAHRLSSISHCDEIIVMGKGNLVERGSHRELLSRDNGIYRTMWESQTGSDIPIDVSHYNVVGAGHFMQSHIPRIGQSKESEVGEAAELDSKANSGVRAVMEVGIAGVISKGLSAEDAAGMFSEHEAVIMTEEHYCKEEEEPSQGDENDEEYYDKM